MPVTPQEKYAEEKALARQCLKNAPGAWETFCRLYGAEAAAAARSLSSRWGIPVSEGDLVDVVQETLLVFVRNGSRVLREFRWESALKSYVRTVAVSRAINWRKRMRPAGLLVRDPYAEAEKLEAPGSGEAVSVGLGNEDTRRRVQEALAALPARERRIVHAYYWEGASVRQIARLIGITHEHGRVLLSRARRRLKQVLESGKT